MTGLQRLASPRLGIARLLQAGLSCACLLGISSSGFAQDRPSEEDMFGAPSSSPSPPASSAAAPALVNSGQPPSATFPPASLSAPITTSNTDRAPVPNPAPAVSSVHEPPAPSPVVAGGENKRDDQILGTGEATPMFTEEAAPDDPLKIGGQIYLRMQSTASQGQRFQDFSYSSPSMLDVYMDARPNDRVRAFARGRMLYDPTLPTSASSDNSISAVSATGSTSGSQSLSSLFQTQTRDPKVYLDQLWVNFDIAHRLFVTAGKQHVRWGTGHFWAPTDYLHLRARNPLDVFDARTGTTMVKLHLPIESRQWNFYAFGVTEGPDSTQQLGKLAGAARAEFVLDATELGLGVFARRGTKPKLAADLSTGIGDFDFYGELALRYQDDIDRVGYNPNAVIPTYPTTDAIPSWQTPDQTNNVFSKQVVDAIYPVRRDRGMQPQVVGGVTYSRKYNDNDTFTVGAEYFYNSLGYDSPVAYPGLVLPHSVTLNDPASFFYLGRHYAALYATFPSPFSLDTHSFTLSTLGNLSDQSFITRLDYSLVVLTHVRFEAFVSGRYGNANGEFRFGVKNLNVGTKVFNLPAAIMDFGMALRVAI
jgi:hypothetical protein